MIHQRNNNSAPWAKIIVQPCQNWVITPSCKPALLWNPHPIELIEKGQPFKAKRLTLQGYLPSNYSFQNWLGNNTWWVSTESVFQHCSQLNAYVELVIWHQNVPWWLEFLIVTLGCCNLILMVLTMVIFIQWVTFSTRGLACRKHENPMGVGWELA